MNDENMNTTPPPNLEAKEVGKRSFFGKVKAFISSPLLNGLGMLFGLAVGFYFWQDSKSEPQLYGLSDTNGASQIVTGFTPRLEVRFDGNPIKGDVVSQQLKIWNRGKKPIKPADILERVGIEITPKVRILEVRLVSQVRSAVGFDVDFSGPGAPFVIGESKVGDTQQMIGLRWKILEQGDGATIQVIYEGQKDVKFSFVGAIEGQKTLVIDNLRSTGSTLGQTRLESMRIGAVIVFALVILLNFIPDNRRWRAVKENAFIAIAAILLVTSAFLGGYVFYDITFVAPPVPPF